MSRALVTFSSNNILFMYLSGKKWNHKPCCKTKILKAFGIKIGKSISLLYYEREPSTLRTLPITARTVMPPTMPLQASTQSCTCGYSTVMLSHTVLIVKDKTDESLQGPCASYSTREKRKVLAVELTWKMPPSDYRKNTGDSHGEWNAHKALRWPFECTGTHRTSAQGILQKT